MKSRYIWMNGTLVPSESATVPFMTPALHYGIAVYEGVRAYRTPRGSAVFRLAEHADRLVRSAEILGFRDLGFSAEELALAMLQTVAANDLEEAYIRPLVYLTDGGWNLNLDAGRPQIGIAVWEWKAYLGEEARERGVRVNVSSFTRHHPNVSMTKAKVAGNYVNSVLAKTESVRLGFDEAILLDPAGLVAEGTGQNLFVVRRGKIFTPPLGAVLEGITRDCVLTLAHDLGIDVQEVGMSRDELYGADEVFLCGTASEVIGVREIDFRRIGSGRLGAVTRRIQEGYLHAVHGEDPRYAGWLTPVDLHCLPWGWEEGRATRETPAPVERVAAPVAESAQ